MHINDVFYILITNTLPVCRNTQSFPCNTQDLSDHHLVPMGDDRKRKRLTRDPWFVANENFAHTLKCPSVTLLDKS